MFASRVGENNRAGNVLFGSGMSSTRVGRSAENDLDNLGKPRMKQTIKISKFGDQTSIEEVQYQMALVLPSNLFNNKRDR